MATELRCKGTRTDGKRCRSVFVSKETNLCPAHAPGGTERMSEMGKVGVTCPQERYHRSS